MPDDDLTPIRQQYLDIKIKYPDSILFFRLGDFYETFDHDAEITSRELDIVLTSRAVKKGNRVPMAGIPFHAVENYLSRLIDKGYHVAICEQMGDQPQKGLFPREVVRIVTPGTIVEPALLDQQKNNFLLCFIIDGEKAGIAYTDITTGEFSATEISGDEILAQVRSEISRLRPAEILISGSFQTAIGEIGHLTHMEEWRFDKTRCTQVLHKHFSVGSLDGFGLRNLNLATISAGVIIQYLQETQPTVLSLLTSLSVYSTADFMVLDSATRRNLELTESIRQGNIQGSLLQILDHATTAMGHRLMRKWFSQPLLDKQLINDRLDNVSFYLGDGILRTEICDVIKHFSDLERMITRIITERVTPREIGAFRETLRKIPSFIGLYKNKKNAPINLQHVHQHNEILTLLDKSVSENPPTSLQDTGIIRAGYSSELDDILETSKHAREWISNLEDIERNRTGIKSLKVGYNKVFGYFIEITHSNKEAVPTEYIRKQTLVNAERYITPELKEYETLVLNAEERIRELEIRLFKDICREISVNHRELLETAWTVAEVDVYCAFAEAAATGNYVRPEITDDCGLEILDGRHPVVERSSTSERFIPNDMVFEEGEIIRIITGPNMSGKSTFLRQVALIVFMTQIGCFVPAASAKIGLVDRIFTRIGAQDEIYSGQSTFMVEMTESANILHHATKKSLLILDEIGRGTSTYDGLSIAWAMIEYIHNHPNLRSRTLFATHYHELLQLKNFLPGARNYNVAVIESEGKVVFLHKIVAGGSDKSYGIHVAQLAGLPGAVINRANELLRNLEASAGDVIQINPTNSQQMALFPETNPIVEELDHIDPNSLSPIEALNKFYEWKKKYSGETK
jgi:DNA mismatch repair protein MutS